MQHSITKLLNFAVGTPFADDISELIGHMYRWRSVVEFCKERKMPTKDGTTTEDIMQASHIVLGFLYAQLEAMDKVTERETYITYLEGLLHEHG